MSCTIAHPRTHVLCDCTDLAAAQPQFGTPIIDKNMFTVSLRFLGEWRPAKALTPCLKVHTITKGHWGGSPRDSTPTLFKVVGREPLFYVI